LQRNQKEKKEKEQKSCTLVRLLQQSDGEVGAECVVRVLADQVVAHALQEHPSLQAVLRVRRDAGKKKYQKKKSGRNNKSRIK
jgi:hypothetical protein